MEHTMPNSSADGPKPWETPLGSFWVAQGSPLIRAMLDSVTGFAPTDLGIRIVGERGTGKIHLARLIHSLSSRCQQVFTHVDCKQYLAPEVLFGTVQNGNGTDKNVPGILESSVRGTIYLNDPSFMPGPERKRLFRAIELKHVRRMGSQQDIPINVRFISGITKNTAGEFERNGNDLKTRLSHVCVNIPPLRERREDIGSLIRFFGDEYGRGEGRDGLSMTAAALGVCLAYDWPGNIHELKYVVRHSAARCDGNTIDVSDLPDYMRYESEGKLKTAAGVSIHQ